MQVQTQKHDYSPEEYFQLEEVAENKSEYRNGEIVPMTGSSTNHNQIVLNFCAHLYFSLRGQNYRMFVGDVRLWIPRYRRYNYPDMLVISGDPVYHKNRTDTLINPRLIVEVLSNSTKDYDRGDKFKYYRSIPDFREYILIDQYQLNIEQFAKNSEGKWVLTEYESEASVLTLDSIDFQISLNDLYEKVNFELGDEL